MSKAQDTASEKRRADTRRKIEYGGLVIKAGFAGEDPALILGALILARESCDDPVTLEKFLAAGKAGLRA